jgi:hypothetical protein
LITLGPNRVSEFNNYDPITMKVTKNTEVNSPKNQEILDQAISYYQHASYIWKSGMYNGAIENLNMKEENGTK